MQYSVLVVPHLLVTASNVLHDLPQLFIFSALKERWGAQFRVSTIIHAGCRSLKACIKPHIQQTPVVVILYVFKWSPFFGRLGAQHVCLQYTGIRVSNSPYLKITLHFCSIAKLSLTFFLNFEITPGPVDYSVAACFFPYWKFWLILTDPTVEVT
jgi:hypothetical protein